jgi:hypothetical protein
MSAPRSATTFKDERMAQMEPLSQSSQLIWRCRLLAVMLILCSAGLHATYLAVNCPLDLAPDEAHYWDWSRHLDWSYYSKGPLVAYLIRSACEILDPWASRFGWSPAFAVRAPAILCGSLLLLSLYVLTVQVYQRDGVALAVVGVALTLPVIGVGSSLMTIDSPYCCCWGWALVLGHRAIFRGSRWAWPALGVVVGLGILAKYNMAAWIPSAGLFLLFSPEHRKLLRQPGFWIMTAIALLCCFPILYWNVKYDWVSFRHVQGLAGLEGGSRWYWNGPVAFLGAQCGLYLVFWFLAWAATMIAHRPWKETDAGLRYLWWLSAPMFAIFLIFSFKTGGGEPNWPVTAYISGLVLAIGWVVGQLHAPLTWHRRLTWTGLILACVFGLAINVVMHRSDLLYAWTAALAGSPSEDRPLPLRKFDPTCRLRGWRTLAAEVDRLREEWRRKGEEPVLVGAGWSLPGELGFYCAGHPIVYSIGPALGDRRSQFDLWRPNPISDAETFAGQSFIVVGNDDPRTLQVAFERVEQPILVTHYVAGQPVARWSIIVAHGYRGFPLPRGRVTY